MSVVRLARLSIWLCPALAAPVGAAGAGAVHHCRVGDEPPVFSQFPCSETEGRAGEVRVLPLQTVNIPALTAAERERLRQLERARQARHADRQRARARRQRIERRREAEQSRRCRQARAAEDALARQRRKGYSLGEARALDRRTAELAAEIRENC